MVKLSKEQDLFQPLITFFTTKRTKKNEKIHCFFNELFVVFVVEMKKCDGRIQSPMYFYRFKRPPCFSPLFLQGGRSRGGLLPPSAGPFFYAKQDPWTVNLPLIFRAGL
jgi:hypothetical protein